MTARIDPTRAGLPVRLFAKVAARRTGTEPPKVFLTIGRNPRLFWGWLHFAGALMPGGRLTMRETELVILRVAARCGSVYELSQHRRLARRAGLSADEIDRSAAVPADTGWSEREQLLLAVTDELHTTEDLSDVTWQALRSQYDEACCVEVVMLVGHYRMLATTLGVLRVEPDRARRD